MKNIIKKIQLTIIGLLLTTIVYSEEFTTQKKNIQKQREFIEQHKVVREKEHEVKEKKNIYKERVITEKETEVLKKEHEIKKKKFNESVKQKKEISDPFFKNEKNKGGCPLPPCEEIISNPPIKDIMNHGGCPKPPCEEIPKII